MLGISALLAVGYLAVSLKYRTVFLPNTTVSGIPVAGMSAEEVEQEIYRGIDGYELTLEERDGEEEVIRGGEIGLSLIYDGSLEEILKSQNPFLWGIRLVRGVSYEQNHMVMYEEEKLREAVNGLACFKPENITEPADAYLSHDDECGLVIVPEEEGNRPVPERLLEEVKAAVSSLTPRISLDALGVYEEPEVLQDNAELLERKKNWEKYSAGKVTYRFGSRSEVVDADLIFSWLTEDEASGVMVDRPKVEQYVKELAKKYNTAYSKKELKTSYGPTVTITQGSYGWIIDQKTEVENLIRMIESGEGQECEPAYLQTAASHDGPDYGDTYVEINLTAQHLFYYKNGKKLIESDFVSGNEAKGWSTPAGAYPLTYKQKDATLKGANYKTPVTYWMPFNGNIGMHDGYWRSSFGGTIYKKNGSHGCVNLPPAVAKTIFENIEKGVPVLCYHLKGTETDKTTKDASGKAGASNGKEKETRVSQPATATVPAGTAPEGTASEGTVPEGTVSEGTVSEGTAPEGTAPEGTAPAETASAASAEDPSVPVGMETTLAPGDGTGGPQAAGPAAENPAVKGPAAGPVAGPAAGPVAGSAAGPAAGSAAGATVGPAADPTENPTAVPAAGSATVPPAVTLQGP